MQDNPENSAPEIGETVVPRDEPLKFERGPDAPLEIISFRGNGERTRRPYTQRDLDENAAFKAREMFAAEVEKRLGDSTSGAAAWLLDFRAKHRDFIAPVEFQDETGASIERHFVKRLSDSEIVEIGVLMAREGFSAMAMQEVDAQHAFYSALLAVGVCDALGARFFADANEARLFYEAPGAGEISSGLRGAIFDFNPSFARDSKKKMLAQIPKN